MTPQLYQTKRCDGCGQMLFNLSNDSCTMKHTLEIGKSEVSET
jgi:hypothetical protein